ncbi:hypothetical protein RB653_001330 [Dictyostelium firmibasis]|uniref:Uncharacterized protein n=1 Tax=Dictyostelium firmibasis TaxID=79012 RepID=A0AAN7YRD5_9MYCE
MDDYTKNFPWMYIIISFATIISVTIFYILVSFFIKRYKNRKNEELGNALLTQIVYTPHYNCVPINKINGGSGHYSIINQQPLVVQQQKYYSDLVV